MKSRIRNLILVFVSGASDLSTLAQWQGTNPETLGAATTGAIIGTGGATADLTIRGHQMNAPGIEQFHSIGYYNAGTATEMETHWRMFRLQGDGNPRSIGQLYATNSAVGSTNFDFNLQQTATGASLWIRNRNFNGIRLRDDANDQPNFMTGACTNTGWRYGYAAIGIDARISFHNAPWSRWTLVHYAGNTNTAAFRSFMRNGTTMIGNGDLMYVGQLINMSGTAEQSDQTDAAIAWYDNNLPAGATHAFDNCTFRFLSDACQANAGPANTGGGLEIMRLRPFRATATDPIQGFAGIGDWVTAGVLPDERLDVLDRTVRVRQLPTSTYEAPPADDDKVVVVRSDGRLNWRDASAFGGADCDWTVAPGAAAGDNDVSTAFGTATANCPDETEAVGIGVDLSATAPLGKLDVRTNNFVTATALKNSITGATATGLYVDVSGATTTTTCVDVRAQQGSSGSAFNKGVGIVALSNGVASSNANYGLRADVSGATRWSRGVSAVTNGAFYTAYGGEFIANDNAAFTTGVLGLAQGGGVRMGVEGRGIGSSTLTVGVNGRSEPSPQCDPCMNQFLGSKYTGTSGLARRDDDETTIVGIYGRAILPSTDSTNAWAAYFDGRVHIYGTASCSYMAWTSDENLKTNVQQITGAMELIDQLHPSTYSFLSNEHPRLGLPGGMQRGFLAQDVAEVMPDLVSEITALPLVDSTGTTLVPGETVKALNYIGFVPVIVAALQEQNQQVRTLQDQLAAQTAQIAAMQEAIAACCAGSGATDQRGHGEPFEISEGDARSLIIQPNPFSEQTTLYYTLERNGRMQLMANSADGKQLRVLHEASLEAGQYQHEWHTADLSPGVYYVTLLLDGEAIVKKAVKVQR